MYVSQVCRRTVLIASLVLVTTVRRFPLRIGVDADKSDTAAELPLGLADGRNDDVDAIWIEQIDNGVGHRDRQALQSVALVINLQPALEEVATLERKDDNA